MFTGVAIETRPRECKPRVLTPFLEIKLLKTPFQKLFGSKMFARETNCTISQQSGNPRAAVVWGNRTDAVSALGGKEKWLH
jgi:hypothetical protein